MKFKTMVKKLFRKSKTAIAIAIGLLGFSFIVNSLKDFLPEVVGTSFSLVVGLVLVIISGFLINKKFFK